MNAGDLKRRSRLSEIETYLLPFVRARDLNDISLYWIPVDSFPMPQRQRAWIREFHQRLDHVMQLRELRVETFLQFKTLYPDLLNAFVKTANEYQPVTGVGIVPGEQPPELPTFDQIQREVDKGGVVDVNQWMTDYCHWFLTKKALDQRRDFFGHGGMLSLYLKSDRASEVPELEIPKIMRTHPLFEKMDVKAKLSGAYSVSDGFLAKSKEMFGEPFREDPAWEGILFVIPLLGSRHFLQAAPAERQRWFELFDAYVIESTRDKGLLVAVRDPKFDTTLEEILQAMHADGLRYPR